MITSVPLGVESDSRRPCWWPYAVRGNLHIISVRCGNGHITTFEINGSINALDGERHEVDEHGNVILSAVCPHEGCGWHVRAKLEGWK